MEFNSLDPEKDWAEESREWGRAMRRPNPVLVEQIQSDFSVIGEEGATSFGRGGDWIAFDPKTRRLFVIPDPIFQDDYMMRGGEVPTPVEVGAEAEE